MKCSGFMNHEDNIQKSKEMTEGTWKVSPKCGGVVVVDSVPTNRDTAESIEYYGSTLIAESCSPADAKLIAAAPDLLATIKYYFAVLDEARGKEWREKPDHVAKKMLDAVNKATK